MSEPPPRSGCGEYRDEMVLIALRRRLELEELSEEERRRLEAQIERLEAAMGLD